MQCGLNENAAQHLLMLSPHQFFCVDKEMLTPSATHSTASGLVLAEEDLVQSFSSRHSASFHLHLREFAQNLLILGQFRLISLSSPLIQRS